jgi:hypothetical protein
MNYNRFMFIAHAPAGYILGVSLARRLTRFGIAPRVLILACVLGALAPDLDMLYFYLVDNRQTHHHKYFTHWRIVWLGLTLLGALWAGFARQKARPLTALLFCVSAVIHLILDTLVGDIWWLAPFGDKSYVLFVVPALFKPWWLSFILHWSFAVELGLLVVALLIYRRRAG